MTKLVSQTAHASIVVQVLTGIFSAYALFVPSVPPEHRALKTSLAIEMIVQGIEFIFYAWLIHGLVHQKIDVSKMAAVRYYDWFWTTPLMLFSTMLYFKYEESRKRDLDTTKLSWLDFLRDHWGQVAMVLGGNFLMILLGYAGEVGQISRLWASIWGFAAFIFSFSVMYVHFASKTILGTIVFSIMAVVWALYGVVYGLPAAKQNSALNILDIVAKNMFGLYLTVKVLNVKK